MTIDKRWLATGSWGDAVRLVPVPAPSTGPDVFCKVLDAQAAIDAAVAAERERWRAAIEPMARDLRNHDVVRMTAAKCLDAGLRAAAPTPRPGAQKETP